MTEPKTKETDADADAFIAAIDDPQKQADCKVLKQLFEEVTGKPAKMWGPSIVGFDMFHYRGRSSEGDWMVTGFSPRKANLTLYFMDGYESAEAKRELAKLGKATTAKSCLYIKKLSDVNMDVLRQMITRSVAAVRSDDFIMK